jgi:hypothetical protein
MCCICATLWSMHELAAGRLVRQHGVWRWLGDPVVPPGLAELIESRIGALSTSVSDVVDALAVGEPIELASLTRITDPAAVEEADMRGLITLETVDAGAEVRVAALPARHRAARRRRCSAVRRPRARHHRGCRRSTTGVRHFVSSGPHSRRRAALRADPDPGRGAHRPAPLRRGIPPRPHPGSWDGDRRSNDHRPPRGNPTPPGQSAIVRASAVRPSSKGCTDHDHPAVPTRQRHTGVWSPSTRWTRSREVVRRASIVAIATRGVERVVVVARFSE